MKYTEPQVKQVFLKFLSIKSYLDKLQLFDANFNLIPFPFPAFAADLNISFSEENLNLFQEILKIEQHSALLLERTFYFEESNYVFSVKPTSKGIYDLNNYIIQSFINKNGSIENFLYEEMRQLKKHDLPFINLLENANRMLNYWEYKLNFEYKSGSKFQFITVFFKGLQDFKRGVKQAPFYKRKKFIELYLYAYGYFYGQYLSTLHQHFISGSFRDLPEIQEAYDIDKKIELLQELGFIDALKAKYVFLSNAALNLKIIEIVSSLTGEKAEVLFEKMKEKVDF